MDDFSSIKVCEGICKRTNSGDGCCIAKIYSLLKDHAKELKDMEEAKFAETPLHKAAAAGNTAVALELLSLMPSLGGIVSRRSCLSRISTATHPFMPRLNLDV